MRLSLLLLALLGSLPPIRANITVHESFSAVPRLVMFHGSLFQEPIVLTVWSEVTPFYSALRSAPTAVYEAPGDRPFVDITFFWYAPAWERYVQDRKLLRTLRAEDALAYCPGIRAICSARYYPAYGLRKSTIHLIRAQSTTVLEVTPTFERLLQAARIPTKL